MGIHDFYQVIKGRAPGSFQTYHLSEFRGHRFAVDISIFLNKYIKSAGERLWMNTFFLFLCTLKKHGIKTVCIFDGPDPPPEKAAEQERRRAEGQKALARLERCIEVRDQLIEEHIPLDEPLPEVLQKECQLLYGKPKKNIRHVVWSESTDALDALKFTIERLERSTLPITTEHRDKAKAIAEMMGLPIFQAQGEAEALCTYLAVHNYVDAVLTEDTDVLAYGTPWMVAFKDFKLGDEKVYGIHLQTLRDELGYDQDELRDLCILLGCDYNDRIKGFPPDGRTHKKPVSIGLKGALAMIDEYRRLEEVVKHVVDPGPLIFRRCREIFTPPTGKEVLELIKVMPYNLRPDIEAIREFIQAERLTMSVDFIEKCWQPGEIVFHNDDSSDSDDLSGFEEEDEDIEALLGEVRKVKVSGKSETSEYCVELSVLCCDDANDDEEEVVNIVAVFASKDDFDVYEGDTFGMLTEHINEWLLGVEKKYLYVDDCIEVEKVYARRPEGVRVLEVEGCFKVK